MMSTNYGKLKTNLRLCIQRLKMAEKKKTELAQKSRREIAEYLSGGKSERARIRVEHIIREDYLVEAMELVEMYCDLLITRFGMIQQMKTLDDGLAEAISSIIWVAPRLQSDVSELKIVAELLTQKYGKPYAQAARENSLSTVSPQLIAKLSVESPPPVLVEKYMIEIAKMLNVPYEPNELLLKSDEPEVSTSVDAITTIPLIDFNSQPVATPPMPPSVPPNFNANSNIVRPIGFDLPSPPTHSPLDSPMHTQKSQQAPKDDSKLKKLANELNRLVPQAPSTSMDRSPPPNYDSIVSAPSASSVGQSAGAGSSAAGDQDDNEEIDFDDLARRFEALKRAK